MQPLRGVLRKKCSENMQQINRNTHLNVISKNFIEIALWHGHSPVNLPHIFSAFFLYEDLWKATSTCGLFNK